MSRELARHPDKETAAVQGPTINFLHVGKAAGTQISGVIEQINASGYARPIVKHGHETGLASIPVGEDYFFSTRDPATRFKSGFYSRLRKGRPRLDKEWSADEAVAFGRFAHANELAESLFAPGAAGLAAAAAMRSIRHCSRNLVDWFKFCGELFVIRPPIWIIRQEHFTADLGEFLRRIGYSGKLELATDDTRAHRNNYEGTPELTELAIANLQRWYVQDYEFLRLCQNWMEENSAAAVSPAAHDPSSGHLPSNKSSNARPAQLMNEIKRKIARMRTGKG